MNIQTKITAVAIGIVVIVGGLFFTQSMLNTPSDDKSPATISANDSGVTEQALKDIVFTNNEFALNMYVKLATEHAGKNVFFSPYSISTALSMVYEGSHGSTTDEIAQVLLITDGSTHRSAMARIYNDLNAKNSSFTLKTANALWTEKTYSFTPAFLNTIDEFYKGSATALDFKNEANTSRLTINSWVEKQTENKIKDLIPTDGINPDTRLVLTNAIYFKGKWALEFDKDFTQKTDFHISTSTTTLVDMMSITGGKTWNYAESKAGQLLELPYAGDRLSMLIVLPRNGSVNPNEISELKDALKKQSVNVYIPRFKMNTSYDLKKPLIALGMPTAFTDTADFSGISAQNDLKISDVFHKAFVEVNEEGTEAAAATGVIIKVTSVAPNPTPIPDFKADHPFLFMIRDMKTDQIIFMGKVVNPNL